MDNIILLGRQRAGKSTAASMLCADLGFVELALADGVRKVQREIFGVEERNRGLAIGIGNALRGVDGNVWVNHILRQLSGIPGPVVISDVRFPNEYEAFVARGFRPLRIAASVEVRRQRPGFDPEWEGHWTEAQLDALEMPEVCNEGTLTEFRDSLMEAVVCYAQASTRLPSATQGCTQAPSIAPQSPARRETA